MKKIQFWSLLLGFVFGSVAFVACGDDKDDTNTPTPTENNGGGDNGNGGGGTPVSIVGTWKADHVGSDGTRNTQTIVVGNDKSYKATLVRVESIWVGATKTLKSYEYDWVGTWEDSLGYVLVNTTEYYKWDIEQDKKVKDESFTPSKSVFLYSAYGNGIVAWGLDGGINFFTKDGAKRQLPSMANHELCGRWECVQQWAEGYNETVQYYQFDADGSIEEGAKQRHIENQEVFQGSRSNGFYVPIEGQMLELVKDMNLPSGAKLFSFVEENSSWYGMNESGTFAWAQSTARYGGHPLQYVLKNATLYVGVIGMDEEYFYQNAFTKK